MARLRYLLLGKDQSSLNSQDSQLPVILLLFVILRLSILFLYTPQGLFNAFIDYHYYFRTAELSLQGYYPFVNMWYEYPPIGTYLVQGVFTLTHLIIPYANLDNIGFQIFARMLGTILLIFDAGVLILIYQIGSKIWDHPKATWLAWVYSVLSLPLFYWSSSHSIIVTFFVLLAINLLIREGWLGSALSIGLGVAAKITPVILFPPVAKFMGFKNWKKYLFFAGLSLATSLVFYLPFIALGGWEWVAASFKALGKVASWSTIWALIDGNWGPGNFGPLLNRIHLELASIPDAGVPVIPELVRLIPFALLYGWLFLRPIPHHEPRIFVWFSSLTVMIFHLWSKGWSPQWATLIIPLFLLSFPNRIGLGAVLLLTGFTFIESPLASAFDSHFLLTVAILGRTTIITGIAYLLAHRLWGYSQMEKVSEEKYAFKQE